MSGMVGRWDTWNATDEPAPYCLSETYALGAEWLKDCELVEDWGCGRGYMRTLIAPERYRGIDGSGTQADVRVDLLTYRSLVPGIFMRHVLEHNYGWRHILRNAVDSFTERMVLVLFTPLAVETTTLRFHEDPGVPDISFALADLESFFDGVAWSHETLASATDYGEETIFRLERGA